MTIKVFKEPGNGLRALVQCPICPKVMQMWGQKPVHEIELEVDPHDRNMAMAIALVAGTRPMEAGSIGNVLTNILTTVFEAGMAYGAILKREDSVEHSDAPPTMSDLVFAANQSPRPIVSTRGEPLCPNCGHEVVRNGACYKCLNCGESLGCT